MHNSLILLILSVIGFALAWHIWNTKRKKKNLFCIIGKDCNKVIRSEHAKTLGIENTVLGMLYYVVVFLVSLIALTLPLVISPGLTLAYIIFTVAAALFSVYLASVQLFKLKELCEYCLANTAIVVAIFILVLL